MDPVPAPRVRLAQAGDDDFILGLADRFVECELPPWRRRGECASGLREDIARHLREQPAGSHVFVAEDEDGSPAGFLHLQTVPDSFTDAKNCHISDLAVAPHCEGRGIGGALLRFAEDWARTHHCRHVTLAVFPRNERALALYQRHGFGLDLLRMAKRLR
ncbi:GNAT family N-acetyltransferase [Dokdonella sp.]|uniref:GNAT family N-acetyltransferase n=1 Tax=Dokdonella sp. TaxID=2291710 RepID=UPI0026278749|nr:GNAT family N-acetyltransferase [Dokdonella sp.]